MATVIQQDGVRRDPRRWWALGALIASMLVLGFDLTILNVALPTMARDLAASADAAYVHGMALVLLVSGVAALITALLAAALLPGAGPSAPRGGEAAEDMASTPADARQ